MIYLFSFLPSILCLITFWFLDNFSLVSFKRLILYFVLGVMSAICAYYINSFAYKLILNDKIFTGIFAPLSEEFLKTLIILFSFRYNKIGFLTEAILLAFIAGIGFATFENLWYIHNFTESNLFLWLIRGSGTALLHASSTIVFSIIYFFTKEKKKGNYPLALLSAIVIHSVFNLPFIPVMPKVLIQLVLLPVLVYGLFFLSEKKLNLWMEKDFEKDFELLEMIKSGNFSNTKYGKYLATISESFPPLVKVDIFCYAILYIELSFYAKGLLLMKEVGLETKIQQNEIDKLNELKELEKNIGKSAIRVLRPILPDFNKKMWQVFFLRDNL
ncbi:MAG TPA: PrsW family glutamic-type intramembrane protease [Candidatus Cloacimonadota bacterium]|nr:PrsW family glutamic-type intramembrane protease [Candidatus Cloacimonadota bacterium]HPM03713.1 PrsW family glutamic-type intramembrane protease [Candidatus Cloacimonadota bacterium]